MSEVNNSTKVVIGAGSIVGVVFAVILSIGIPAVNAHIAKVDASTKADIRQDEQSRQAKETNDLQDAAISLTTKTDATQTAKIEHNEERMDMFAVILKDFVEGQHEAFIVMTDIKVGQARTEEGQKALSAKIDAWEPERK